MSLSPQSNEMRFLQSTQKKTLSSSTLKNIFLFSSILCVLYIFLSLSVTITSTFNHTRSSTSVHLSHSSTSLDHVVFGLASNAKSWPRRKELIKLWWKPQHMHGCVFLDKLPSQQDVESRTNALPPICISNDTSSFRYTYRGGLHSAIRVARVVSETVALNHTNVRWYVFGDDDTLFVPENLVKMLSKYDHDQWYYIGANSETLEQNSWFSFEMPFGGAGFAISSSLAKVFAKVFDSCLVRYPYLYGSDSRSSCMAELGIGMTHELGFHQIDVRGDIYGLLAGHPPTPLISLHHLDYVEPIFPNMNTNQALQHLFKAVRVDPERILQRTFCYNQWYSWTVSISWGYVVQVYEYHVQLPDLLPVQKTFKPWNKQGGLFSELYMFNTYELHNDPCRRPKTFFLDSVSSNSDGIETIYKRNVSENCLERMSINSRKLESIRVFSQKLDRDIRQLQAPRRQCSEILRSSTDNKLDIAIRECGEEELIYMQSPDENLGYSSPI